MQPPANADPAADPPRILARATLRAADRLGLRGAELAAILGTSPSTVSRLKGGQLDPAGAMGQLAALFLRVYRSLDALVGGDDLAARAWLRAPHRPLNAPPLSRMQTVEGLVATATYLDAMRGQL